MRVVDLLYGTTQVSIGVKTKALARGELVSTKAFMIGQGVLSRKWGLNLGREQLEPRIGSLALKVSRSSANCSASARARSSCSR